MRNAHSDRTTLYRLRQTHSLAPSLGCAEEDGSAFAVSLLCGLCSVGAVSAEEYDDVVEGVMDIVITIPGNPESDLSPNARVHWRVKSKAKQEWRTCAFWASLDAITQYECTIGTFTPFLGVVDVHTTIAWGKGRRTMDGDNALACMKSGYDGLTRASIWLDDKQCRFHPVKQIRDKAKVGFVEVTIVEAER